MKKLLALVLSLMLVLSLASCAAKKPTANYKIYDADGKEMYSFSCEITGGSNAGSLLEEYLNKNSIPYTIYQSNTLESINDIHSDTENWSVYWAFYLNGEYAAHFLWEQDLKDGDLVELKVESFNG